MSDGGRHAGGLPPAGTEDARRHHDESVHADRYEEYGRPRAAGPGDRIRRRFTHGMCRYRLHHSLSRPPA
ncbi:hypothetical protein GCM10010340_60950 [Streptomyces griseoloalbus]|nr:hypothetical protein GCM10010340_60950 [Streptomyces albaduncus]